MQGQTNIEYPPEFNPRRCVERWRITAVGRRPHDFVARDALVASLIRDPRGFRFQKLIRKPPDWLVESVEHVPEQHRQQALQVNALHLLHQQKLAGLLYPDDVQRADDEAVEVFGRVRDCTPCGALVERVQKTEDGRDFPECGRPRVCPWCHARKVVRAYRSLTARRTIESPYSLLVQARATVTSDELDLDIMQDWIACCRRRGEFGQDQPTPMWYRLESLYTNAELRPQLLDFAHHLGLSGGLVSLQAGPCRLRDRSEGYRFELGLIGDVPFATDREREKFMRYTAMDKPAVKFALNVMGRKIYVELLALPAEHPLALRLFLAGSSWSYPVQKLPLIGAFPSDLDYGFRDGLPGILGFQPIHLFDDLDFWRYSDAMQGINLFSTFGDWKKPSPQQRPRRQQSENTFRPHRTQKLRPLRRANESRKGDVEQRRRSLLEVARTVWPEIKAQVKSAPGRPPYKRLLVARLKREGLEVSDRDARWLMEQLKDE